jgi:hypothetical protein
MGTIDDRLIEVRGAWNAWRTAEVPVGSLVDVHWAQPAGAPRPMVHAYTFCSDIVTGDIPHDCASTPGTHRLLVCVLKRSVSPPIYAELVRQADASFRLPHVPGVARSLRIPTAVRAS